MQATHDTYVSPDSIEQPLVEPVEHDLEGFLRNVSRLDGVQANARPEADVCGALGCHLTEHLGQVCIDGFGKRVLCPIHVLDLVDREVGLNE